MMRGALAHLISGRRSPTGSRIARRASRPGPRRALSVDCRVGVQLQAVMSRYRESPQMPKPSPTQDGRRLEPLLTGSARPIAIPSTARSGTACRRDRVEARRKPIDEKLEPMVLRPDGSREICRVRAGHCTTVADLAALGNNLARRERRLALVANAMLTATGCRSVAHTQQRLMLHETAEPCTVTRPRGEGIWICNVKHADLTPRAGRPGSAPSDAACPRPVAGELPRSQSLGDLRPPSRPPSVQNSGIDLLAPSLS